MTDFGALLATLGHHGVAFVLVGGAAAVAHGSARLTQDIDILYERTPANFDRLVAALSELNPYLRGAPPGLPFVWDSRTLARGLNFTLTTAIGEIDLFGEIPGVGDFRAAAGDALELTLFGTRCLCISLPRLIQAKRAAGRPKDLEVLAELEAIEEENR
jgi:hypothetical protein